MLLIFSLQDSTRLRYICNLLLEECLGLSIRFTHDPEEARKFPAQTINYSPEPLKGSFHIPVSSLLFEVGVKDQDIRFGHWQELPVLFSTTQPASLPFDIFSAAFYLITRYEEWLPHIPDEHGRFPYQESIAWKKGFLQRPLVNEWLAELRKALKAWNPQLQLHEPQFNFQLSLDIDMVCAYRHKGWKRNLGGLVQDLFKMRLRASIDRLLTLLHLRPDRLDNFDWQLQLHRELNIKPRYFWLMADYGPYNKNLPPEHPHQRFVIQKLQQEANMGLHPGYGSYLNLDQIKREKHRLEKIIGTPITHSRQHFLQAVFPHTFRNLLESGIRHDYTLGYDAVNGFRTSLAGPAPFFDLELNRSTELLLHPFQVMDVTLLDYQKHSPQKALEETCALISLTARLGGTFTLLWHNESLSENIRWKDWRQVYVEILKFARHAARGNDPATETLRSGSSL